MKKLLWLWVCMGCLSVWAQQAGPATDQFVVTGRIMKDTTFTLTSLLALESTPIPDLTITNHMGEPRGVARGLRGVLVKDLLQSVRPDTDNPKLFSEYHYTFVAADGYKVVFSWNELFNSPTGDHVYLVVEKEGKTLGEMPGQILVITTTDFRTGRRHIKALEKIVVGRAD